MSSHSSNPDSQAPPDKRRYAIEAFNLVGCDPGVFRWWLGLEFVRWIHGAAEYGHSTDLKEVLVIDELLNVFSKELFRDARVGVAWP